MLSYLKISNLAILDDVSLEPGPGLNVLTGETGAGKSIMVDALGLVLGERGSADLIRSGADRLIVEAQFEQGVSSAASAVLREGGLVGEDGGSSEIVVRRELTASGRGRAWINGRVVTQTALKSLGETLADLHGQHQHQSLLREPGQREALDRFAAATELCREVAEAHEALVSLDVELEDLTSRERDKAARLEWLTQQVSEIEAVAPRPGEGEELAREESILRHSEEVARLAGEAFSFLSEEDDSIVTRLGAVQERLARLAEIDTGAAEGVSLLAQAQIAAAEVAGLLARYRDRDDMNPRRLEEVATRLVDLQRLERKYGGSLESVAAHLEWARGEVASLGEASTRIEALLEEARRARDRYYAVARRLSARRRDAARRLQEALGEELCSLAMEGTRVEVALSSSVDAEPASHGIDSVEFLIAPNRGEQVRPLGRIASGGELSRLMLGLRNITNSSRDHRTLVFDEVDSGIGGRVAEAVGLRLEALARSHQILCVTHLPQIASFADRHFLVTKGSSGPRTCATVQRLDGEKRVEEIARMLGGSPPDTARRHAAAMMSRRSRATP